MKGFGLTSILFAAVMILILVSVIMMGYTMYACAGAKAYEFTSDPNKPDVKILQTEGVAAHVFWDNTKTWMIGPTVCNVMGMALLSVLYVMA